MAEAQISKIGHDELLKKVEDLEKRLQTKDAEIQVYKMLTAQMEEEVAQAKKYKSLHEKQTQDVDSLRTESEKTLTKAKSMIFEKTKIIKNQELQIEAFTQQIESLREVVRITKDLLEIRNLEVQQLEIKISAIDGKQKAEKERYDIMHKKLEMMIRHNAELKREYETQLCLFTALRERYNERELAKGVVDNLRNVNNSNNAVPTAVAQDNIQIESNVKVNDEPVVTSQENIRKVTNIDTSSEQQPIKNQNPVVTTQVETTANNMVTESSTTPSTNAAPEANVAIKNDNFEEPIKSQDPVVTAPVETTEITNTDIDGKSPNVANTNAASEQILPKDALTVIAQCEAASVTTDTVTSLENDVANCKTNDNTKQHLVNNQDPEVIATTNLASKSETDNVVNTEIPVDTPTPTSGTVVKEQNPDPSAKSTNSNPKNENANINSEQTEKNLVAEKKE